ncbi:Protein phosphatase 1 regulatory subunit 37-like protein [Diplonema papillatum]|nr:Protein phosphatase 1 regulatory subunit 37-like protein [Diplonema papillatum]|eukprot:gene4875-7522_t
MSVDINDQWMAAISTDDLLCAIENNSVNVASFYSQMAGKRMTRPLFERLLSALYQNTGLKVLDMDHNEIGRWPDGVSRLLCAVSHITTLERLNLNSSQIADDSVPHICEFLEANRTLKALWLYGNNITFRGLAQLHVTLVAKNPTLRTINLQNNGISISNQDFVYQSLATKRPRDLTLKELCRLHVMTNRIKYRQGVFTEPSDAWQELLSTDAVVQPDSDTESEDGNMEAY